MPALSRSSTTSRCSSDNSASAGKQLRLLAQDDRLVGSRRLAGVLASARLGLRPAFAVASCSPARG